MGREEGLFWRGPRVGGWGGGWRGDSLLGRAAVGSSAGGHEVFVWVVGVEGAAVWGGGLGKWVGGSIVEWGPWMWGSGVGVFLLVGAVGGRERCEVVRRRGMEMG